MAVNRKRHTNSMPMAALSRWMLVAFFLCIAGLGYVNLTNQLHQAGSRIKDLERQLASLETQTEVARTRVASLSSRAALQRRLNEGFIKMIPITDDRIVRINSKTPGEIRQASNRVAAQ